MSKYFPGKNFPYRLTVKRSGFCDSTNYDSKNRAEDDFWRLSAVAGNSVRLTRNGITVATTNWK